MSKRQLTHAEAIAHIRAVLGKIPMAFRPTYAQVPASLFEPHSWVIQAVREAYARGLAAAEPDSTRDVPDSTTESEADAEGCRLTAAGAAAWYRLGEVSPASGLTYSERLVWLLNYYRDEEARAQGYARRCQEETAPPVGVSAGLLALVATLYDAGATGFHTCESAGLEAKFRQVARFGTLEDLHAHYQAWLQLMTWERDRRAAEVGRG